MIGRTVLLLAALLLAVSGPSYSQTLELSRNEPFAGERIFCVEVTGTVGQEGYPLSFILSLADKDVPIRYLFNGWMIKEGPIADREFKGRQRVPVAGKYTFTFLTTAQTTITKFEVQGGPADRGATLRRCT